MSTMDLNRNILLYILLTIVLIQFCFISQLIEIGSVDNPQDGKGCNHYIVKRSASVQFTTDRECPSGCRRIGKRPSQNFPPQYEQRIHSYSYLGDQGRTMRFGDQMAGLPGPRGIAGMQGQDGLRGPVGASGIPGRQGSPGRNGQAGEPGAPGPSGSPGRSGQAGEPGATGPSGGGGVPGERGRPGQAGNRGMSGISGPRGLPGPRGSPGYPGVYESGDNDARGQDGRGDQGQPIDRYDSPGDSRLEVKELKVAQALQTLKLYNNPNCIDEVNHQKVINRLKTKGTVSFMILVDLAQNVFCIVHS